MALVHQIQVFLKRKFIENKLKAKEFARESNIPYNTIFRITKAVQRNPELKTILKIADYFKCSIDEVVGRSDYISLTTKKYEFTNISTEDIGTNLRQFLNHKLKEQNLSPYKLASIIGLGDAPIYEFIKDNSSKKCLSSLFTIAIADYFKVSLDEMVGRISPTQDIDKFPE